MSTFGDAGLGDHRLDLAGDEARRVADVPEVDGAEGVAHDHVPAAGQLPFQEVQGAAGGHVTVDQQYRGGWRAGRLVGRRQVTFPFAGHLTAVAPVAAQKLAQVDGGVAGVGHLAGQIPGQPTQVRGAYTQRVDEPHEHSKSNTGPPSSLFCCRRVPSPTIRAVRACAEARGSVCDRPRRCARRPTGCPCGGPAAPGCTRVRNGR